MEKVRNFMSVVLIGLYLVLVGTGCEMSEDVTQAELEEQMQEEVLDNFDGGILNNYVGDEIYLKVENLEFRINDEDSVIDRTVKFACNESFVDNPEQYDAIQSSSRIFRIRPISNDSVTIVNYVYRACDSLLLNDAGYYFINAEILNLEEGTVREKVSDRYYVYQIKQTSDTTVEIWTYNGGKDEGVTEVKNMRLFSIGRYVLMDWKYYTIM